MREILNTVENWLNEGKQVALATVVLVYGSAPRGLGAKMAVNDAGQMVGSVSGGCVEGAVVTEALKIIRTGKSKLIRYGVTQEQAMSVGLACGGTIEVFIEPIQAERFDLLASEIHKENLTARALVLTGKWAGEQALAYPATELQPGLTSQVLQQSIQTDLKEIFENQQCTRNTYEIEGEIVEIFFDLYPPSPKLVIVGAVHIAIPLVEFGNMLDFHTIVVDPRKAFATPERFPSVDELVLEWPEDYLPGLKMNEGTYFVAVSHDEKLDVPGLAAACSSKARYIGALGSKKTFANNVETLKEMGVSEEAIGRIHSPIGMDIGARGPQEIALAIIAEITAVRNSVIR